MNKMIYCFTIGCFLSHNFAHTCTRATYLGPKGTVITGRSMDWARDVGTNLWIFPRCMKKDGAAGVNSLKWTAKYGSIIASFFDAATADGMNEKGLVANLLYLAESEYPNPGANDARLPVGIAAWAQYVLDNFATVEEAVSSLKDEPFYVLPTTTPDGEPGKGHLAISDPSGDSAIFEYVKGKLVMHHGRQYQVLTNSPTFDQQLALDTYWQQIGGRTMLPGTSRAADRFVRASFYIKAASQTAHEGEATAAVFSVIRNASAPMGVSEPGKPNIAPTLWRTVADQKNRLYYFESTKSPDIFWVDLADIDFDQGPQKLDLQKGVIYSGNVAKRFVKTEAFKFLPSPLPLKQGE